MLCHGGWLAMVHTEICLEYLLLWLLWNVIVVMECYGMLWNVLECYGCFGRLWSVMKCFGCCGMFWSDMESFGCCGMLWNVLVVLDFWNVMECYVFLLNVMECCGMI